MEIDSNLGTSCDIAATIETGGGIRLKENTRIYLVASYSHGFLSQWESAGSQALGKWKNRTVGLKFGVQRTF